MERLNAAPAQAYVLHVADGNNADAEDGQNRLWRAMRDQQRRNHEAKTDAANQHGRTLPMATIATAQTQRGKDDGQCQPDLVPCRMLQQMAAPGKRGDQHNARHAMHEAKGGQAKRQSIQTDSMG